MARDWIVGREAKSCGNYSCSSRDGVKAKSGNKFSLNAETGVARFGCGVCGQTTERKLTRWWERKACESCGYVRTVKVSPGWGEGPHWNRQCDACELLTAAGKHLGEYQRRKEKALRIYETRGADVPPKFWWGRSK